MGQEMGSRGRSTVAVELLNINYGPFFLERLSTAILYYKLHSR